MQKALALLILTCMFTVTSTEQRFTDAANAFQKFSVTYGRDYSSMVEYMRAFSAFTVNLDKIDKHNSDPDRMYDMRMNGFGDKSFVEFWRVRHSPMYDYHPVREYMLHKSDDHALPSNVDWRSAGLVTNIKNQGECGSCWAFSAVASIEGQHAKKTKKLVSLSEQNLVDCAGHYGCMGCGGGWMNEAMEYVEWNGGIDTEKSYPYLAQNEPCNYSKSHVGAKVTGVVNITKGSDKDLLHAVATVGPISVAIDASVQEFQFYSDGIYTSKDCSTTQLDHGVTIVGYGENAKGKKYYIIKNSWGTDWGMNGYMYWNRDIKDMCGIAQMASYPLV